MFPACLLVRIFVIRKNTYTTFSDEVEVTRTKNDSDTKLDKGRFQKKYPQKIGGGVNPFVLNNICFAQIGSIFYPQHKWGLKFKRSLKPHTLGT